MRRNNHKQLQKKMANIFVYKFYRIIHNSVRPCNGKRGQVVKIKKNVMKNVIPPFVLLLLLSACNKNKEDCQLIPAKIIRYDCDRVNFQLLTNDILGDSSWLDVNSGQRYTNVVSVFNTCEIAAITRGEFSTLYVNLDPTDQPLPPAGCVQCLAAAKDPPKTKVIFRNIATMPCAGKN